MLLAAHIRAMLLAAHIGAARLAAHLRALRRTVPGAATTFRSDNLV
jgi:hypothetical protein